MEEISERYFSDRITGSKEPWQPGAKGEGRERGAADLALVEGGGLRDSPDVREAPQQVQAFAAVLVRLPFRLPGATSLAHCALQTPACTIRHRHF